jgi:hypothetical protein
MRGGIPAVSRVIDPAHLQITLPAGYLGSSLIGAALIACVSPPLAMLTPGIRHERIQSRQLRPRLFPRPHLVLGAQVVGSLRDICHRHWPPPRKYSSYAD